MVVVVEMEVLEVVEVLKEVVEVLKELPPKTVEFFRSTSPSTSYAEEHITFTNGNFIFFSISGILLIDNFLDSFNSRCKLVSPFYVFLYLTVDFKVHSLISKLPNIPCSLYLMEPEIVPAHLEQNAVSIKSVSLRME